MKRVAFVAAAVIGLALARGLATPAPAAAEETGFPGDVDLEGNGPDYWREQALEARANVADARERYSAAQTAFRSMKQRRRPRGEARVAIEVEYEEARAELAKAEQELESLDEQARRAGAPPGWLRVDP